MTASVQPLPVRECALALAIVASLETHWLARSFWKGPGFSTWRQVLGDALFAGQAVKTRNRPTNNEKWDSSQNAPISRRLWLLGIMSERDA